MTADVGVVAAAHECAAVAHHCGEGDLANQDRAAVAVAAAVVDIAGRSTLRWLLLPAAALSGP